MDYTEVIFTITPYTEDVVDTIIAELSDNGYEGFTYTDTGFGAYISAPEFKKSVLNELQTLQYFSDTYRIDITHTNIEDQDWNRIWEENFTPIIVDGKILVRAGFHDTIPGIEHEIIIEPKMSFGTGHHSTTALMLGTILDNAAKIEGKRVLDMGCGTGILSIMAAKTGAKEIVGIDIDEWAYNNAMENIKNNGFDNITIKIGDASLLKNEQSFNIILANINRNILLNDMPFYVEKLNNDGYLVMSGFFTQDIPMIREKAEESGLVFVNFKEENNWVSITFYKS